MYAFKFVKKGACNLGIVKNHDVLNVAKRTFCDIKGSVH